MLARQLEKIIILYSEYMENNMYLTLDKDTFLALESTKDNVMLSLDAKAFIFDNYLDKLNVDMRTVYGEMFERFSEFKFTDAISMLKRIPKNVLIDVTLKQFKQNWISTFGLQEDENLEEILYDLPVSDLWYFLSEDCNLVDVIHAIDDAQSDMNLYIYCMVILSWKRF